jgi:hypothetical protein
MLGRVEHACVFYDRSPIAVAGRCRIQSALGHDSLPLACRQFPRVSVHDPRGVSVTLSHYCPTAAGLLDAGTGDDLAIVINPDGFPADGEYIGLDARTALPPLLRKNMLMDWPSWWACEEQAVGLFRTSEDPAAAMQRLRSAVADLETWSPEDGPLVDRVNDAFASAMVRTQQIAPPDRTHVIDAVFASIPADLRPARFPASQHTSPPAARRYLAAHAFGSWAIHREGGLQSWLMAIETAAALIDAGAGVRQADLLLRHYAE